IPLGGNRLGKLLGGKRQRPLSRSLHRPPVELDPDAPQPRDRRRILVEPLHCPGGVRHFADSHFGAPKLTTSPTSASGSPTIIDPPSTSKSPYQMASPSSTTAVPPILTRFIITNRSRHIFSSGVMRRPPPAARSRTGAKRHDPPPPPAARPRHDSPRSPRPRSPPRPWPSPCRSSYRRSSCSIREPRRFPQVPPRSSKDAASKDAGPPSAGSRTAVPARAAPGTATTPGPTCP